MEPAGPISPDIPGLTSPLPLRLAKFVERQHGVVARRQLLAAGMRDSTIDGWIRHGHLHLVHRGVYAVGHRLLGREGEWMAAVLACGEGSVLSHGPSGQLFGFIDQREHFAIHVSLPDRKDRKIPGIVTHRPRSLLPADTTRRLHIPTTTATRTIYDLASTLPLSPTRRAFEKAERLSLLSGRGGAGDPWGAVTRTGHRTILMSISINKIHGLISGVDVCASGFAVLVPLHRHSGVSHDTDSDRHCTDPSPAALGQA
jgi:hypothetical protein